MNTIKQIIYVYKRPIFYQTIVSRPTARCLHCRLICMIWQCTDIGSIVNFLTNQNPEYFNNQSQLAFLLNRAGSWGYPTSIKPTIYIYSSYT